MDHSPLISPFPLDRIDLCLLAGLCFYISYICTTTVYWEWRKQRRRNRMKRDYPELYKKVHRWEEYYGKR